jgi:hypothetical protein
LLREGKLNPPGKNPSLQQDAYQRNDQKVRKVMIELTLGPME